MKVEDLEAGELATSWSLEAAHSAVSGEEAAAMLKQVAIGILLSSVKGAWDVSGEMNHIFPSYEYASAFSFLTEAWKDH